MKPISGDFQHALVVADIDIKIRNIVRKIGIERRKVSLLKNVKVRKQFKKVVELVDADIQNFWTS